MKTWDDKHAQLFAPPMPDDKSPKEKKPEPVWAGINWGIVPTPDTNGTAPTITGGDIGSGKVLTTTVGPNWALEQLSYVKGWNSAFEQQDQQAKDFQRNALRQRLIEQAEIVERLVKNDNGCAANTMTLLRMLDEYLQNHD